MHAEKQSEIIPLIWPGATVVVCASGPSLTAAGSLDILSDADDLKIITANNAAFPVGPLRRHRKADIHCYAADSAWWNHYGSSVRQYVPSACLWGAWPFGPGGEQDNTLPAGVRSVRVDTAEKNEFQTNGRWINSGGNSGFQAINLAIAFGAARVVLLGFDMAPAGRKVHFHADHVSGLRNPSPDIIGRWRERLDAAPVPTGVEILNASVETALQSFPRKSLAECLAL